MVHEPDEEFAPLQEAGAGLADRAGGASETPEGLRRRLEVLERIPFGLPVSWGRNGAPGQIRRRGITRGREFEARP